MPELTAQQQRAAAARGNVLVMAGAGTGKTRTLVERCVQLLLADADPVSLDEVLLVTFTEAAAAEMRQRIRQRLEDELVRVPGSARLNEQLALVDSARICTLHSFCLQLIREHFPELDLDPQLAVLGESQARILASRTLDEVLERCCAGEGEAAEAVQNLLLAFGDGSTDAVHDLALRIHEYTQTLPDPPRWLESQYAYFSAPQPATWGRWLVEAFADWRRDWLNALAGIAVANEKARALAEVLRATPEHLSRPEIADVLRALQAAEAAWPKRQKGAPRKPLEPFLKDVHFLAQLASTDGASDPLAEDWGWVRPHLLALVSLAREFANAFANAKRELAAVDFHDLEQFALRLLWDARAAAPTALAGLWRERLRFVFVDEYQDINAAQDAILRALSRDDAGANRFLVGDVKQSIYRFRLANPGIFQRYAADWRTSGAVVPLNENFRSAAAILDFVNALFTPLMRRDIGGVEYDQDAQLHAGAVSNGAGEATTATGPAVELALRLTGDDDDGEGDDEAPSDAEAEAALVAARLREWKAASLEVWDDKAKLRRPVCWQDMVVLLRACAGKAETYARVFQEAGVPLWVRRSGLYEAMEVRDLLSLLELLDNPLQDIPTLAVLRSPMVGLSLDELAVIRLARRDDRFWTALCHFRNAGAPGREAVGAGADAVFNAARASAWPKVDLFLRRHARWRNQVRQGSVTQCLEAVLDETGYEAWLATQPRAAQRQANLDRLLALAGDFDRFQRQGLFRFLNLVRDQREVEYDPEPAQLDDADAVRLMTIHQSKGLEFPVVVVAGLGQRFNLRDFSAAVVLDEHFGLAPRVQPPHVRGTYPSLPHWLAARRGRTESLGEELRLLYVATTRAREKLLLVGTATRKKAEAEWSTTGTVPSVPAAARASSCLDWLGPLMPALTGQPDWLNHASGQGTLLAWSVPRTSALEPAASAEVAAPATPTPQSATDADREWQYAHRSATVEPAKASVTGLRRRAMAEADDEAAPLFRPRPESGGDSGFAGAPLNAAERGVAHHRLLQFVSLPALGDRALLEAEAVRLVAEGRLGDAERAALDLDALADFGRSELGRRVQAEAAFARRELEFTARLSPADFAELALPCEPGLAPDEFVVVQGVVDLAVIAPAHVWIVDFKTDRVNAGTVEARAADYASQLRLYARALGRIYARPVTGAWLHFLAIHRSVAVPLA